MPTEAAILLRLARWLGPGFPTGAFAWSHGLETDIAAGRVSDGPGFARWLRAIITKGAGRNDAILLACAWRAQDAATLDELADLATALAPGSERHAETRAQGAAFAATLVNAGELDLPALPLPIAVGSAARAAGLPLHETLLLHLQNFAMNLVTIAVRHIPLGQSEGQAILADLAPLIIEIADEAARSGLDDLGGCTLGADLASLEHENLPTRIFRS
ncbi:urease accessory protein UreF [Albidovulum inexpectatum]|nr:urease accessory protein UreF [Albidovulum inexpectatum]